MAVLNDRKGPLTGVRVIEIASAAPAPFACMMLSDLGADVIRVDRAGTDPAYSVGYRAGRHIDPTGRGRRSIAVNLKHRDGVEVVRRLINSADVVVEGFRPGVMERLGLGPDELLATNPALIYGRMSGWGQAGPLASTAGHDLNYLALSGALYPIGPADGPPPVPLNYIADFGGGAMTLVVGVLAALLETRRTGTGQIVDASMMDGASLLTTFLHAFIQGGGWSENRADNLLDGAAPFYRCYETADGEYIAVACIEPPFYDAFVAGIGLTPEGLPDRNQRSNWPILTKAFGQRIAVKTRKHWEEVFHGTDACVTPVLHPTEARHHGANIAREAFVPVDDMMLPAPTPRLSLTPTRAAQTSPVQGEHTIDILQEAGFSLPEAEQMMAAGALDENNVAI